MVLYKKSIKLRVTIKLSKKVQPFSSLFCFYSFCFDFVCIIAENILKPNNHYSMKQGIIVLMAILAISCGQKKADKSILSKEITAEEIVQTSGYTYVRYTENDSVQWLATTVIDAKVGEKYYFEKSMEMKNFHSKELNRDFKTILFVDKLTTEPVVLDPSKPSGPGSAKAKAEKVMGMIEKTKEELTVADLYAKKESFADKTVQIKGKVVKVTPRIMNKNWVHIQDGTESEGSYDLIVTTLAELKVGDIVTLEGKLALDKDFGYGYKYDLIVEDALVK